MTAYIVRTGGKDTKVSLTDSDFVASGGEKAVYRKGDIAYCVYHNIKNVTPSSKIDELAKVQHPGFIKPTGLLLDSGKARVGEILPFIKNSFVLCELFSNAFRKANKVNDLSILSQMFDLTKAAHQANVILVDHNDMNWLTDLKSVSLVDTVSAQTPNFQATAIKAAIRDPFALKFDAQSDHYSLAILTAWLWCGIHPFTVNIEGLKAGMPEKQLLMRSIFDAKARLNASVRPIETMPDALKSWVHSHLTTKDRPAPPSISGAKVKPAPVRVVVPQQGNVTWELLTGSNPWVDCCYDFMTGSIIRLVNNSSVSINGLTGGVEGACDEFPLTLHDGKIYLLRGDKLYRIDWRVVNGKLRFSNQHIVSLADMPHATIYGQGCIVQDLLGRKVINQEYAINLPKHRVIHAVAHQSVVMLTTLKAKKVYRIILGLEPEEIPQATIPNFCVTNKGVIVENRDGELIARLGPTEKRGPIPPTMELLTDGVRVLGIMDKKPYQIKLNNV